MGRIRTIKPEFPQSESVGELSRDARLLFIQLWTFADDAGRCRAATKVLTGALYPYDNDAGDLIEGWLTELEQRDMIARYVVKGNKYLQITKWSEHQKIDRPSKSRLPEFVDPSRCIASPREPSREIASPREPSMLDHGPGTMDQGSGTMDQGPRTNDQGGGGEPAVPEPARRTGSNISEEAFALSGEILVLMGLDPGHPLSAGSPMQVQSWLNGGWPRDAIIGGVQQVMLRKRGDPPSTLKYFEKAIARAHAEFTRPLPIAIINDKPEVINFNGQARKPGGSLNAVLDAAIARERAALQEAGHLARDEDPVLVLSPRSVQ